MAQPADTSADGRRMQLSAFRRMTGPERVAMAFEMADAARAITEFGIRHRHPDWSDGQVAAALVARILGPRLTDEVRRSHLIDG